MIGLTKTNKTLNEEIKRKNDIIDDVTLPFYQCSYLRIVKEKNVKE